MMGATKKPKPMGNHKADNFQTDPWVLDYLVGYLPKNWKLWESACGQGNLVKSLEARGFCVRATDIKSDGHDFIKALPLESYAYDALVTNPPYSIKDEWIARCYELRKPFALLLPVTVFDSIVRRKLFDRYGVQIIFLPRRAVFTTPNGKQGGSWFYTMWVTFGLNLPEQLNFPKAQQCDLEDFIEQSKRKEFGTAPKRMSRRKDPQTSKNAAKKLDSAAIEKAVLKVVESYGRKGCRYCDVEAAFPNRPSHSITPRFARLLERKQIEVMPEKRMGLYGVNVTVVRAI